MICFVVPICGCNHSSSLTLGYHGHVVQPDNLPLLRTIQITQTRAKRIGAPTLAIESAPLVHAETATSLVRSVRTQNRKHSQSKHSPRGRVPLASPHIPPVQTSVPDSMSVRTSARYIPYWMSTTLFLIVALSQTRDILQRDRLVAGNSNCNSTHQAEGERHNLN